MKNFFKNPLKVARWSFISTIIIAILLFCVLQLAGLESKLIHLIGKVTIAISLPFLLLNPLLGFIYSFYIKGRSKILYILLHLVCIGTISFFAFITMMFRYFVPFAP